MAESKARKTATEPAAKQAVTSAVTSAVKPDVKPDVNQDVKQAAKPAVKAAAKPTAKAAAKPPVKPRKPESHLAMVRRARRINRELAELYPYAHPELDFENPFQLLVATVLSAQTTDLRVNQTTPALFAKYPTPEDMAAANPEELEEVIRPTGFYRSKAKSVQGLARAITDNHGGEVPDTLEELVKLPGVGRKTANVVLGNAFDTPGITVDTHLGRLARRWMLTDQEDPVKTEQDLNELIERKEWTNFSHRAIFHGRRVCHSRRPACGACFLARQCPSFGAGPVDPQAAAELIRSDDREHLLSLAGLE